MAEAKKDIVSHLVVCTGLVDLVGGKLGVELIRFDEDRTLGTSHVFEAKKELRRMVVGGVYTIDGNESFSSISLASASYVRAYDVEPDKVATWRTRSKAVEVARAAEKSLAEEKRKPYLAKLLRPLILEYRKSSHVVRLAIEVEVLRTLRGEVPRLF